MLISWKGGGRPGQPSLQYEILGSAYGGGNGNDGCSAVATHISNLHITPIEILESEFPCRIVEFDLVKDSGGAGEFRGGLAFRRIYELLQDATVVRRYDRAKFPPNGVAGGKPGSRSRFVIHLGGERRAGNAGFGPLRIARRRALPAAERRRRRLSAIRKNATAPRLRAISPKATSRPKRRRANTAARIESSWQTARKIGSASSARGAWGFPCSSTSSTRATPSRSATSARSSARRRAPPAPRIAQTPAEVGKASDIVILGVGYDDEVNDVVFGKNGLIETMAPGSIIAVSSTAKPDTVKAVAARVAEKGIEVLDAPICRGRFAADSGTLLALVGGKPEVVARARPVYGTFASDIVHLGDVGHGQVGKTMNNLLLWVNAVGLLEAGRLAETTGIDLVKLREALMMSSGASDALKEWDMISFTWALKDMQIVADMTDKAGLSLPITGAIKELVKDARRIKASNPPNWTGNKPVKYG